MGEAVDLKLTANLEFKHDKFTISEVATDAVYLSENELAKLYSFDFSNYKKLDQVRDLFIFGCYVELRFSDYSTIKKENIVNIDGDLFIKVITEKTEELVIIPCNPIVLEILINIKAISTAYLNLFPIRSLMTISNKHVRRLD